MDKKYINYHKHSHFSNISTPDVIVKPDDYIKRMKELGHNVYSTCEHRFGGNYLEAYDICKKEGFKMIYVVEAYYVDDRLQKDDSNYHIILIAKNIDGFKDINRIISEANVSGFYYKPRIDLSLLLSLNPNNIIITTACVGGRISGKYVEDAFLLPVYNYFGNNFYLEVQNHMDINQISYNKYILELHSIYKIPLIHANDSHYIFPEDSKYRDLFLKGKKMKYEKESNFILDYPDYDTILERYKNQGVLSENQAINALSQTQTLWDCKDLGFTKDIKMPILYPNENSNEKLKEIITKRWNEAKKEIPKKEWETYKNAIRYEYNIIEKTEMADYFILNYEIVNRAINNYNGKLTKTGRGSGTGFYINNLLKFTEIDRLKSKIPLYPSRFMSIVRILESKSLPDFDYNTVSPVPFVKAAKEFLGDDNVYYMLAYGTMKASAAFRNLCRAYDLDVEEYNEIAKNLELNETLYENDEKWGNIIKESKKYIDVIDSISPSPSSFLFLDKPISNEIGIIRINDEICCCIDKIIADKWKYLKNDFLTVKVWEIIYNTFELLGINPYTISELEAKLDNEIWDIYKNGFTATINQVDTDNASVKVIKYQPKSVEELTAFIAALRPGFSSLLNKFLNREKYTTNIPEIDKLLEDSFCYMLYQESIMKVLIWLGIKEDETYNIISKISKKIFKDEEIKQLKTTLSELYLNKIGNSDNFEEIWQVIEDASRYSFNAAHALSYAWDSIYCAYLKAKYPLEYFTVCLNAYADNLDETTKIIKELQYFNIKIKSAEFRYSKSEYFFDKNTNTIYKGIESIKYLNKDIGNNLYELKNNNYKNFAEVLSDISKTKINSKQLEILIRINYFKEFGSIQKLLTYIDWYRIIKNSIQISKDKIQKHNIPESIFKKYAKETEKKYIIKNNDEILNDLWYCISDENPNLIEQVKFEIEFLGYPQIIDTSVPSDYVIVMDIITKYKNPMATLYRIFDGSTEKIKIKKHDYDFNKFKQFDVIKTIEKFEGFKWKKVENGFIKLDEKEWFLKNWSIIKI